MSMLLKDSWRHFASGLPMVPSTACFAIAINFGAAGLVRPLAIVKGDLAEFSIEAYLCATQ